MQDNPICKGMEATEDNLAKLNRFTRRQLTAEEVYLFSVTLCDNEIDRDRERFTVDALQKLAALFIGVTGIFDHNPKGANQTARIFDTEVVTDEMRKTAGGEAYTCLKAAAYMVRTDANCDLIKEIDGGIKKEVSISCTVARQSCSLCGADLRQGACTHKAGRLYGGKLCHTVLDEPTDAYEWSFVAVPAQRNAGVTKAYGGDTLADGAENGDVVAKVKAATRTLTLSAAEVRRLQSFVETAQENAAVCTHYREELEGEVIRLSFLACPGISAETVAMTAKGLCTDELLRLKAAYAAAVSGMGGASQLQGAGTREQQPNNSAFKL